MCEEWRDRKRETEREREKMSVQKRERENDRRGRRKGKERLRKTTPERLRAEPAAPSQPSSSSLPPCVLRHGYQTGLPMQPVNVFFSGRSELGTNVSQSVSCTINVNSPGMHKHMEGWEPGNTEPPWPSLRARGSKRTTSLSFHFHSSPENRRLQCLVKLAEKNVTGRKFYLCFSWYHMLIINTLIWNVYLVFSWLGEQKCRPRCWCATKTDYVFKISFVSSSVFIGLTTKQVFTIVWILLSDFQLIKNRTKYKSFIHIIMKIQSCDNWMKN